MELVFPWALVIGVPLCLLLAFIKLKKKDIYKTGKKVAGTEFLEETDTYKKLKKKYLFYKRTAFVGIIAALLCGFFLLARPAKIDQVSPEIRNRDIFICMDTSASMDEVNVKLCGELKKVVDELDGERFGITIFNARSVLLVPLTNDYDYVKETIDKLEASLKKSLDSDSLDFSLESDDLSVYNYKYDGTLSDEGSSFIGDGLAACLYDFPDMDTNKERSRIIIFTTDNELNGEPYVSVTDAAALCKKNGVRVFALTPEYVTDEGVFRSAIENTGGGYYKSTQGKAYESLVSDIKKIKTSKMKTYETKITDKPEGLFMLLLICIGVYFVCSRKAKL